MAVRMGGNNYYIAMERRFQELSLDPLTIEELALKGDDLLKMGIPKGPKIGQIRRYSIG